MILAVLVLLAPIVVLVVVGGVAAARQPRPPWRRAFVLALGSTAVWLVNVGLYEHETPCDGKTRCPTVYGYEAPLADDQGAGFVMLLAWFLVPALWVGWRRVLPPLTAGAALVIGPTSLAWWTAPRGDNDGLWTLIFWFLPSSAGSLLLRLLWPSASVSLAPLTDSPHRS